MGKTIAIVGTAENTRDAVRQSRADEIWTMNWFYLYDFIPRISRLFEMHPVWLYALSDKPQHKKMVDHWKWLQENKQPYPIYMLDRFNNVPSSVSYPIEQVTENIFGRKLLRGEEPFDFYGSTVDYMLACAIYEGAETIELYGVEMGSTTEYKYQRDTAHFFIGVAIGRGITIKIQPACVLLKAKRYGYTGDQMIFRQDLERMYTIFETRRKNAEARLQFHEGQRALLMEMPEESRPKDYEAQLLAVAIKVQEFRDEVLIASGGEQLLIFEISEIDLAEPGEYELVNPLKLIPPVPAEDQD